MFKTIVDTLCPSRPRPPGVYKPRGIDGLCVPSSLTFRGSVTGLIIQEPSSAKDSGDGGGRQDSRIASLSVRADSNGLFGGN